jgi:trk/ktr system potassium uptake protein
MFARFAKDLGFLTLLLSLGMLASIPVALIHGETAAAQTFLTSGLLTIFFGLSMFVAFRGVVEELGRRNWYLIPIAIWVIIPAFAAIPLYFLNSESSFYVNYFEAVSGLTTTGASLLGPPEEMMRTVLFWRSLLEWLGGFATIVVTMGILTHLRAGGMGLFHVGLPKGEGSKSLSQLRGVAVSLFPVYFGLTVLCFLLLWGSGEAAFNALTLSMMTLSTGGFTPHSGGIGVLGNSGGEFILSIFMIVGAMNLVLMRNLVMLKPKSTQLDREPVYIVILLAIGTLALVFGGASFANPWEELQPALFQAASALSTSGLALESGASSQLFPGIVMIALVMIGGMAGSSAGGIKIMRIVVLFRHAALELKRLAHRHDATPLQYSGNTATEQDLSGIWQAFFSFIVILAVGFLAFGFLGFEFENALHLSLAGISNAGPLPYAMWNEFPGYSEMPFGGTLVMILLMIFGRLEAIFVLAVLARSFWSK